MEAQKPDSGIRVRGRVGREAGPRWVEGALVRPWALAETLGFGSSGAQGLGKQVSLAVWCGGGRTTLTSLSSPPACSRWHTRAAGASCLDWGPWAAPVPGWDCCWAPPRALDSCVPFTASGGNGPGTMARASPFPTPWTTRRLQSPDARVGAGPLRSQSRLMGGSGVQTAFSRTCGTGQWTGSREFHLFGKLIEKESSLPLLYSFSCNRRRVYCENAI